MRKIFKIFFAIISGAIFAWPSPAQTEKEPWELLKSGNNNSFRGVCAISAQLCWVSGTKGAVLRTNDAGKTWESVGPPNCGNLDFRDIEAWDDETAVIMSSGEEDRIYRTEDGGRTWSLVFEHPDRNAFFDGIAFADKNTGWLMGDPLNGQLLILKTVDGGKTWKELSRDQAPKIEAGEAGFAASGTNLTALSPAGVAIALGGAKPGEDFKSSRIISTNDNGTNWTPQVVPLARSEAGGMFSLCVIDKNRWATVGGNYKQPEETSQTAAFTRDGGLNWTAVGQSPPSGYRSCVACSLGSSGRTLLIAVGPNGTDISQDFGESWKRCSDQGFHVIDFSSDQKAGWAAGSDGRIARWREQ